MIKLRYCFGQINTKRDKADLVREKTCGGFSGETGREISGCNFAFGADGTVLCAVSGAGFGDGKRRFGDRCEDLDGDSGD